MVPEALLSAFTKRFGAIARAETLPGGDAHAASRIHLDGPHHRDRRRVFVKYGGAGSVALFEAEAQSLRFIREHALGQLVVPDVLGILEDPPALCLEWIETHAPSRTPDKAAEEALGRGLAALHGAPVRAEVAGSGFGRESVHFLAGLPFPSRREEHWATYFGEALLLGLAEEARRRGEDDGALVRGVEDLLPGLASLGVSDRPSLVHGDLWSGNVLFDAAGRPVLIDPFAYVGDREVDLAMMQFFGGFSERTFAAYEEALPLPPGHGERRALYELIPLLSHTALFGGSYRSRAQRVLSRFSVGARAARAQAGSRDDR